MKFKVSGKQFVLALFVPVFVAGIGAAVALSAMSSPAPVLEAKDKSYTEITFTKWVTITPGYPMMSGFAGGDVDAGSSFSGEILHRDGTLGNGRLAQVDALYHIGTNEHSFTAQVRVIQDNEQGTAVISGIVTSGWLEGAPVFGRYTVINCPHFNALNGRCFQGTLHIAGGVAD